MTRILLVGGTGFIGGAVAGELGRLPGAEVTVAGRRARMRMDLGGFSTAEFAAVLDQVAPDVVVNCAGLTHGGPDEMTAVNVTGVARLSRALISTGSKARFVHLGSAGEYGRVPHGAVIHETDRPCPVGVYGVTKLAGTEAVLVARESGVDAVVLRVFNPIGPGSPPGTLQGRLSRLIREAGGEPITVGPLDTHRDFVDVRDAARAVAAAATVDRSAIVRAEGLINIASGRAVLVRRVAEELVGLSGYTGTITEEGLGSDRSSTVPWHQADITRATTALDWRPTIDFATSMRDGWHSGV